MSSDTVVFFDFDGTLTRGDSFFPFLRFFTGQQFYSQLPLVVAVLVGLVLKLLKSQSAKERLIRAYLAGRRIDDVERVGEDFNRKLLFRQLRPEGIARLQYHQSLGHCCVLVSASLDVYLKSWAREVGFDDILVSRLEISSEGRVTGRLSGANCQGYEKVRRIESWLVGKSVQKVVAYGNSSGDLPMIRMADEGWFWRRGQFVPMF